MYKALISFCNEELDIAQGEILASDFASAEVIADLLAAGYIEVYTDPSGGATIEVVTELPEIGEANVIYLVPKQDTGDNDVFDEYLYVNDEWELIGSTAIDISGKQDTMQFSTMPTADSTTVGKIIQYIGTTNANYTNGYFYIGITDGAAVPTYSWNNVEVQNLSNIENILKMCVIDMGETSGSNSWIDLINSSTTQSYSLNATIKTKIESFLREMYNDSNDYFAFLFTNNSSFGAYSILFYINSTWKKLSAKTTYIEMYSPIQQNHMVTATKDSSYSCFYKIRVNLSWSGNTLTVSSVLLSSGGEIPFKKTPVYIMSGLSQYNSISGNYHVGDYVYYNELIYKCNAASTHGSWDASKWDEKTYMEYLSDTLVGGALNGSY